MRRDVEFPGGDGTVLRGYLHAPDDVPAVGVVMAHGFSGVPKAPGRHDAGPFTVLLSEPR